MARLELTQVSKVYPGGHRALDAIGLAVADGELVTILGPSGSGKSTLLRVIAGLEEPTSGRMTLDGRPLDGLPPHRRNLAMVFQTPAVYPHLSVFGNIAFGLNDHRVAAATVEEQVTAAAGLLHVGELLQRRPKALSGGERQRVAIARAIVRQPSLLLLDEPFSSLDAPLRASIRADLVELHRRMGTTTLFVTHDQAEAMAVGDRVAMLDQGRLVQVGTPREVYDRPATLSAARFLGSPPMNLLAAEVRLDDGALEVWVAGAPIVRSARDDAWPETLRRRGPGPIVLGMRPEHASVEPAAGAGHMVLRGTLDRLEPNGRETWATVRVGPHPFTVRLPAETAHRVGETLVVSMDPSRAVWFDHATGGRLT